MGSHTLGKRPYLLSPHNPFYLGSDRNEIFVSVLDFLSSDFSHFSGLPVSSGSGWHRVCGVVSERQSAPVQLLKIMMFTDAAMAGEACAGDGVGTEG